MRRMMLWYYSIFFTCLLVSIKRMSFDFHPFGSGTMKIMLTSSSTTVRRNTNVFKDKSTITSFVLSLTYFDYPRIYKQIFTSLFSIDPAQKAPTYRTANPTPPDQDQDAGKQAISLSAPHLYRPRDKEHQTHVESDQPENPQSHVENIKPNIIHLLFTHLVPNRYSSPSTVASTNSTPAVSIRTQMASFFQFLLLLINSSCLSSHG